MKRNKEKTFLWLALVWIFISIISMFISVVSYSKGAKRKTVYAIQDLIDGERFSEEVLYEYTGDFVFDIGTWALTLLCILGVCAILSALIGILIMSKQKPTRWPFIMTIVGTVGTAIPALLILYAALISNGSFPGKITPGLYPIVTPFATALCLYIVIRERNRVLKAHATANENAYISRAGDL